MPPSDARARSRAWRIASLALLALAGCEQACGRAHDVTESVAERVISVEAEQRLGAQMAAELEQQVPLVDDPVVQDYVSELGQALAARAPGVPAGTRFQFRVIDAPDAINAIALPGGYIYVYSGLLRAAETEAELTGVLAHEIGHVAERHVAARLVTTLGIQTVTALALGDESGNLEQLVAQLASEGALSAYGRTAEREADALAVQYMVRAGWDPRGYVSFFRKLAAQAGRGGLVAQFLSTHPDPAERAAHALALIQQLEQVPTRTGRRPLEQVASRLER